MSESKQLGDFGPGWIQRNLDLAKADAEEWPEWMRRAAGLPPGQTKAEMKERIAALEAAHSAAMASWATHEEAFRVQAAALRAERDRLRAALRKIAEDDYFLGDTLETARAALAEAEGESHKEGAS